MILHKLKHVLDTTRTPKSPAPISRRIIFSCLAFLFGFLMGGLSKFLDTIPSNNLPWLIGTIDFANFLGRLTGWALMALAVAVFSRSPLRAAVNAFLFYTGMLISYCVGSVVFAGFMLDTSYLLIWVAYTVVSPLIAYVLWYARGRECLAIALSALVIGYFILQAFSFTPFFDYFDIAYRGVELLVLALSIAILYVSPKQTLISVGIAIVVAYLLRLVLYFIPFNNLIRV